MSQFPYSSQQGDTVPPSYVPYDPSAFSFPPPPQRTATPQHLFPPPYTSTAFPPPPQRIPSPQHLPPSPSSSPPQFPAPPQFAPPPRATSPAFQEQLRYANQEQQPSASSRPPGRPRTLARLVSGSRELVTNAFQDPNASTTDGITPKPMWDAKKTQKVVSGLASGLKYYTSFAHAANHPAAPALGMLNNFVQGKVQKPAEPTAASEAETVLQRELPSVVQPVTVAAPAPVAVDPCTTDQLTAFLTLMYMQQQLQKREVEDPPEGDIHMLAPADDPPETSIEEIASPATQHRQPDSLPVAPSPPPPKPLKASKAEKYGRQTFEVLECLASLAAVSNMNENASTHSTTSGANIFSALSANNSNNKRSSSSAATNTTIPSSSFASSTAATTALTGTYKYISSGSGWREENAYALMANGRFAFSLNSSAVASSYDRRVSGHSYDTQNPTGTWEARGDADSGTLVLTHDNGGVERRTYQRQSDGKFFVGGIRWYRTG